MKFWQPWAWGQIFLVLWENLGISHKKLKSWPPTCATCISTQVIQIKHETWAKIDICFWAFCKFYLWKSFDILQLWFHDSKAISWRGKAKLFSLSPKNLACCRKWGYGWIVRVGTHGSSNKIRNWERKLFQLSNHCMWLVCKSRLSWTGGSQDQGCFYCQSLDWLGQPSH